MLRREFPDDAEMRVSHETIYQSIYVQGRGALRRELAAVPADRAGAAQAPAAQPVSGAGRIAGHGDDQRAARRGRGPGGARPLGGRPDHRVAGSSAIGTLVERSTRFVMLLHLPGGHGADAVARAMTAAMATLPAALRRSLTWDQGSEMAGHAQITARHRPGDLLLRPALALAARQQREHQRAAAPVLPQGHRPVRAQQRAPRRRRRRSSTAGPARPSAGKPPRRRLDAGASGAAAWTSRGGGWGRRSLPRGGGQAYGAAPPASRLLRTAAAAALPGRP